MTVYYCRDQEAYASNPDDYIEQIENMNYEQIFLLYNMLRFVVTLA